MDQIVFRESGGKIIRRRHSIKRGLYKIVSHFTANEGDHKKSQGPISGSGKFHRDTPDILNPPSSPHPGDEWN